METIILRTMETAIAENAFNTLAQLAEFVVNDYQFTDEAKDFADMVLTELEENN